MMDQKLVSEVVDSVSKYNTVALAVRSSIQDYVLKRSSDIVFHVKVRDLVTVKIDHNHAKSIVEEVSKHGNQ